MKTNRLTIPIQEYLFLHIDTVAKKPTLTTEEEIEEYRQFRKMQESSFSTDIIKDYKENSYMFSMYNRIASITVAYVNEGKLRVNTIVGSDDKDILSAFYDIVQRTPSMSLCGFGVVPYHLPMLRKKALSCGMTLLDIPNRIQDSLKKPWDLTDNLLDLADAYKGTSPYYTNLDETCKETGITNWIGKTLNREELTKTFHSNQGTEAIINHSRIVMLGQIIPLFQKLMGQADQISDPKSYIKVTNASIKKTKQVKEVVVLSPNEKLFKKGSAGFIDKDSIDHFKEKFKNEKTKSGRQRMYDIIVAQTNFNEQDTFVSQLKALI